MSELNFSLNNVPVSNNVSYLKPYNIYNNVSIDSIEIKSGTSAAGNDWKCAKVTFKCDEGIYSESIFYPTRKEDFIRTEFDMPNGGKRPACSNGELAMAMVAAIGKAFAPEKYAKLQEMSASFKTFDEVIKGLTTIINASKGVTTSIKLIGREREGKVYAALPKPLGITQDKESKEWYTFPVAIFGDNLTFSNYELQKRAKVQNATKMEEVTDELGVDTTPTGAGDLDFESLL